MLRKITSILLVTVFVASCFSMVVFGGASNNLLPAEISTYTQGTGKVTHEHVEYFNYANHLYSQAISADALCVNYRSNATSTQASPFWLLGSYIRNYATEKSAESYIVNVSMDVKGSVTSLKLMLRRKGKR